MSSDILKCSNLVTTEQLKDCTIKVSQRKKKYPINETCSTELKFASECLMKWFNRKYRIRFLEIDVLSKKRFENENEIDWGKTKCVICNFSLAVQNVCGHDSEEITYYNFIIRKEHFYDREVLKESKNLESLEKFHVAFQNFVTLRNKIHC